MQYARSSIGATMCIFMLLLRKTKKTGSVTNQLVSVTAIHSDCVLQDVVFATKVFRPSDLRFNQFFEEMVAPTTRKVVDQGQTVAQMKMNVDLLNSTTPVPRVGIVDPFQLTPFCLTERRCSMFKLYLVVTVTAFLACLCQHLRLTDPVLVAMHVASKDTTHDKPLIDAPHALMRKMTSQKTAKCGQSE